MCTHKVNTCPLLLAGVHNFLPTFTSNSGTFVPHLRPYYCSNKLLHVLNRFLSHKTCIWRHYPAYCIKLLHNKLLMCYSSIKSTHTNTIFCMFMIQTTLLQFMLLTAIIELLAGYLNVPILSNVHSLTLIGNKPK